MSLRIQFIAALAFALIIFPRLADAQLQLVTNAVPQSVFFGDVRTISATFHNPGTQEFRQAVRVEISQTTSAMVVPLGARSWKELRVLPGQTVLESAALDFPPVKTETKFLVEWVYGKADIIGKTEVLVYPTNLLNELKLLVDDNHDKLGVLDPHQQLTPALRQAAIPFVDLEETELDSYQGKLALIGPCNPVDPEWRGLTERISKLARQGTPVVWMQSPPQTRDKIWPSFFAVPEYTNAVVMVDPELVAGLPDHPQAQFNLIYFCRLAVHPHPVTLPELSANP